MIALLRTTQWRIHTRSTFFDGDLSEDARSSDASIEQVLVSFEPEIRLDL